MQVKYEFSSFCPIFDDSSMFNFKKRLVQLWLKENSILPKMQF